MNSIQDLLPTRTRQLINSFSTSGTSLNSYPTVGVTVGQQTPQQTPQNGWSGVLWGAAITTMVIGGGWLTYLYFQSSRRRRLEKISALDQALSYIECDAKTKGIEVVDTDPTGPSIVVRLDDVSDIYKLPSKLEISGYSVEIKLQEEQQKELEERATKKKRK